MSQLITENSLVMLQQQQGLVITDAKAPETEPQKEPQPSEADKSGA